jgi:quercetin dioxygenase-like cupin family protein
MACRCLAALGCLISFAASGADPATGITRQVVEQHPIEGSGKVLELILVEFPPGAQAPPHVHPATGLNYILSGQVDSQYEGEPLKHYRAGDTYQDPPGRKHLLFRNASGTEALKFLIAVELEQGQSFSQAVEAAP